MIKVAISGNIASGKSSVGEIIEKKGYKVYDTDIIAHKILNNLFLQVKELFRGFDIISNGQIDRKKLAGIVFSDKNKLALLESIIHPAVKEELLQIFNQEDKIVFVLVPQLFEAGFENLFDKIVYVSSDENIRIKRLMHRNNLSEDDAKTRISAQKPDSEKIPKSDFIIENNGTLNELYEKTPEVLNAILQA